nr:MAG TPA_asm: hypothetical protein [Caudoviricetes sp.]
MPPNANIATVVVVLYGFRFWHSFRTTRPSRDCEGHFICVMV